MKEIVVLSGKGGTGKTSLTASFAALANNAVLADCDVDASDLHILTQPEVQLTTPFISGNLAKIIPYECNGCNLVSHKRCIQHCKFNAIKITDDGLAIDPALCEGCGVCVYLCPNNAIKFNPRNCGEWYSSKTRHGPMIHAKLGIAAENSGRLVTLVRSEAKKAAQQINADLILVDGPPGIGCPVIASITGSDCVVVVTEPTVSGIHDLKRILELTNHFKIMTFVVVNRFDINRDNTTTIKKICFASDAKYVGKISSTDEMTQAQIAGKSIIEYKKSKAGKEIEDIWFHISTWIN